METHHRRDMRILGSEVLDLRVYPPFLQSYFVSPTPVPHSCVVV